MNDQGSPQDAGSPVPMPDRWITDTQTTARFPHVTRANADEVAPAPISPLGWCIGWANGASLGVADGYVRFGVVSPDELRWPRPETFGCWGGYFYNQLSLSRLLGARMPGASVRAIDRSYFGDNPNIPAYVPDPRDQNEAQSAKLRTVIEAVMAATTYPPFEEYLDFARQLSAQRPDLSAVDDAELARYALGFGDHLRYTWDVYCYVVFGASIGPGAVQAVCETLGRSHDVAKLFGAVGDVVSASSARALWELSRTVAGSRALTEAFDAGEEELYQRLQRLDGSEAEAFRRQFEQLLAEHGHRGPNEWDLASPTWRSDPTIALGIVSRLRLSEDAASPDARTARNVAERERLTAEVLAAAEEADPALLATLTAGLRSGMAFYRMREAGKDAAVRVMEEGRAPLRELGRRLAARGALESPDHLFQLLDCELEPVVSDPRPSFRDLAAERARIFARLAELEPPYIVSYPDGAPPMPTWPERRRASGPAVAAGTALQGIGVSTGHATGTARIIHDMAQSESLQPGDVLVCATTDPSWVPLFLVAGAVVCNVGALASHAAIVTRELGVPCAVSVQDATSRIPEGATVSVDGSTGTVTVLAAPGDHPTS